MEYYLVTLSDGSTSLVSGVSGDVSFHVQALPDGITEASRTPLNVTADEFKQLQEQALTHELAVDTMSGNLIATPKMTDTPATTTAEGANQSL